MDGVGVDRLGEVVPLGAVDGVGVDRLGEVKGVWAIIFFGGFGFFKEG